MLSRSTLNGFGLWTMDGDGEGGGGSGLGLFPSAAMFNHSCMPTVSGQLEGDEMVFYALDVRWRQRPHLLLFSLLLSSSPPPSTINITHNDDVCVEVICVVSYVCWIQTLKKM